MNLLRRLNWGNVLSFKTQFLRFGDLLAGWKLVINAESQHNISKIKPSSLKHQDRMRHWKGKKFAYHLISNSFYTDSEPKPVKHTLFKINLFFGDFTKN